MLRSIEAFRFCANLRAAQPLSKLPLAYKYLNRRLRVMFEFQILVIAFVALLFSGILLSIFKQFDRGVKLALILVIPLLTYSLGFILRLTANKYVVDVGFFLTDFSALFIYTLFATFLLLGQLKYWKK